MNWVDQVVYFYIKFNDTPRGFSQSLRGLRQGDPFTPYLFVIVIEAFNSILKRLVGERFFIEF